MQYSPVYIYPYVIIHSSNEELYSYCNETWVSYAQPFE